MDAKCSVHRAANASFLAIGASTGLQRHTASSVTVLL